MKLVNYQYNKIVAVGALRDSLEIVPLTNLAPDMLSLIEGGPDLLAEINKILVSSTEAIPLASAKLLAPIPHPPRNIICLGKNYASHAYESHRAWGEKEQIPEHPLIFTKSPMSINGPYDDIPYDPAVSTEIDYEAELAVIIGRSGINIARDEAMTYVFGYSVINDMTARDLQRRHNNFFKGKSLDGHGPMGPWIVTADEIDDPENLQVTCSVNNVEKQNDNTNQMIFGIAETISTLSLGMSLLPGDIIATGTPSGVGFARNPPEFLKPGDEVVCSVDRIGSIRNRIAPTT